MQGGADMTQKTMPIMVGNALNVAERNGQPVSVVRSIPWGVIAHAEQQALRNHQQSLDRLRERGGIDAIEAIYLISGQTYTGSAPVTEAQAHAVLRVMVEHFEKMVEAYGSANAGEAA
jgi:hypothetical protein